MKKGLLVILSGPSGVGKGTVREILMKDKSLNLVYSISMTTRKPRKGEVEGREYFFTSSENFEKDIQEHELLEYARFVNNYYGTPKKFVVSNLEEGRNVLLEIETTGATTVMENAKDVDYVSIFLLPPSFEELKQRIKNRSTESEEVISERLEKAHKEMKLKKLYNYRVINDVPENAAKRIADIIKKNLKN